MRSSYPQQEELDELYAWCRQRRGSISRIAAEVERRDGKLGVSHAAVSRALIGKERNLPVIVAALRFRARKTLLRA